MAQPASAKGSRTESPVPAVAGQKRKRPTEKKYYAVKVGKTPGVYDTWEQCLAQVTGQKGAQCKSSCVVSGRTILIFSQIVSLTSGRPALRRGQAHHSAK